MADALGVVLGAIQLVAGIFLTASGIGSGLGLKLILSGGLSLISQFMGSKTGRDGFKSSVRYGFDNLTNAVTEGAPVSITLGFDDVAPRWISTNLVQEGDQQTLLLLGLIGEGEIEDVTYVRINDAPIESFPGATYEIRKGTADQTSIKDFNQIGTSYAASTHLSDDDGSGASPKKAEQHVHHMRAQGDAVVLAFTWPGGLFDADDDGSLSTGTIGLLVETKKVSETDDKYAPYSIPIVGGKQVQGDWYTDGNAGLWKTKAKTRSALRRQIRLNFSARDAFSVRIKGTYHDDANSVRVPTLTQVIEVLADDRAYPNRAVIALRAPAQAQLTSVQKFTCGVKGLKCLTGPSYTTRTWTRNPVWCLREVILSSRFGFGDLLTAADVDATSWEAAATECDATVTPPGKSAEALHELDLTIDTKAPARDWISHICTVMRGTIYQSEGKLKLVRDKAGASGRHFDARQSPSYRSNVLASPMEEALRSTITTWSLEESQRWTGVKLTYWDRDQRFERRTIAVTDKRISIGAVTAGPFQVGEVLLGSTSKAIGRATASYANGAAYLGYVQDPNTTPFQNGETITGKTSGASAAASSAPFDPSPERWLEIQMPGITRRTSAIREARYHLLTAQLRPTFASWGYSFGDFDEEVGDLVDLSVDWLPWTEKTFQVLATGWERSGRGTIEAREYNADVYAGPFDPIPPDYAFTPGGVGGATTAVVPTIPADLGSIFDSKNAASVTFGLTSPSPPPPAPSPPPATPPPPTASVSNVTSKSTNTKISATSAAILSAKKSSFSSFFGW